MAPATFDDETLEGGTHLVVVTGELDLTCTGALRRRLEAALVDERPRVVVDLSAVTHMDSSGLAELLSAHQRASGLRGTLVLVVDSGGIERTLQIRGVDGMFTIVRSRADALAALR